MASEVLYWTGSYGLLFLLFFGLIQFLSNGWLSKFLRVKASRGKKLLVNVHGLKNNYPSIGDLDGSLLKYKDKDGNNRSLDIKEKDAIYRAYGVYQCEVDDELNAVLTPEWKGVEGFDAKKFDNLLERAIYSPDLEDLKDMALVWGFRIITLALLAWIAYQVMNLQAIAQGATGVV